MGYSPQDCKELGVTEGLSKLCLNTVATTTCGYVEFKLIKMKYNENFSPSFALATFQVFNNHWWPLAIMLHNADIEYFHHLRKFY